MKLIYSITALYLFFATTVIAEVDHFISPGVNSQYTIGDTIPFLVDDMPDEDDLNINANLHKSDGSFVKTIKTWSSPDADENGEDFPFKWLIDVAEGGIYYVEIKVGTSTDEVTQSYPFTVLSKDDPLTPQPDPVQEGGDYQPSTNDPPSTVTSETPIDQAQESDMTPDVSMEQLSAADDIAVAQEKALIAQQQHEEESPKHTTKHNHKVDEILRHANAVDIANKVKAAAAINKAASLAHVASKQKRNAYRQVQRNRSKFSKWNL